MVGLGLESFPKVGLLLLVSAKGKAQSFWDYGTRLRLRKWGGLVTAGRSDHAGLFVSGLCTSPTRVASVMLPLSNAASVTDGHALHTPT